MRVRKAFEDLAAGQFDYGWWGERPREPESSRLFGSRGRSPHQIDKLPKFYLADFAL
jgi:hypothetical protein